MGNWVNFKDLKFKLGRGGNADLRPTLNRLSDLDSGPPGDGAAVKRWLRVVPPALFVCAALLSFFAGQRGFFVFDQSIVFDGAYRIALGQVPFVDFQIPYGIFVFWIQSCFFRFLGVNYGAYLLHAALANGLFAWLSFKFVRIMFPDRAYLAIVAGIIAAAWFYPPFGTPYPEQTGFLLLLLACVLLASIEVNRADHGSDAKWRLFLCGALLVLTFLSKQNVAAFGIPIFALMMAVLYGDKPRFLLSAVCWVATGAGVAVFAFMGWLIIVSDPYMFYRAYLKIPSELGAARLRGDVRWFDSPLSLWQVFSRGTCCGYYLHNAPTGVKAAHVFCLWTSLASVAGCCWMRWWRSDRLRRLFWAGATCLVFTVFQIVFIHSTLNQAENSLPFLGIVLTLAAGIFASWAFGLNPARPRRGREHVLRRKLWQWVTCILFALVSAYVFYAGIRTSFSREVHDVFSQSRFGRRGMDPQLRYLRWADPTPVGKATLTENQVKQLLEYLRVQGQNFFVFPDFTILYGLVRTAPPQPLAWFHRGLTYPFEYDRRLDEEIVENLKRRNVRLIVIEEESYFGTASRLADFPCLKDFIAAEFIWAKRIGLFSIYEKKAQTGARSRSMPLDTGSRSGGPFIGGKPAG